LSDSDVASSAKTCFVAMPITTPDAYAAKLGDVDHFAHVLTHLFTPALQAAGLKVLAPSVAGSEIIHAEIIKNLEQADFVLCDLSDLNPNVLFELGIRTSLDRPVMHVRDDLTGRVPFDIAAVNTHTYNSSLTPWSLAGEIPRLTEFVKGVMSSENPGNAMWRYFGLTKRGKPSDAGADPTQAKLDLLISEMAKRELTDAQSSDLQRLNSRGMHQLLAPVFKQRGIVEFGISGVTKSPDGKRVVAVLLRDPAGATFDLDRTLNSTLNAADLGDVEIEYEQLPNNDER
jgi:hypothetical protein